MQKVDLKFGMLWLHGCNLGDTIEIKLKYLQLEKLRFVTISYDPISNREIKQLLKIDMPSL
jgi:hypothetical protein